MPEIADVATLTTISTDWGNDIRDRTIQRYATVAARTIAHPAPAEGDLSYLADSNTVWVFDGTAWLQFSLTDEVDGSVEVDSNIGLGTTMADVASVNLAIPTGWGSWKCAAHATFKPFATTGTATTFSALIRIDGTDQQTLATVDLDGFGTSDGAVGGRRTGMTTTGSRAVSLRMLRSAAAAASVTDIYLYARAVRTS